MQLIAMYPTSATVNSCRTSLQVTYNKLSVTYHTGDLKSLSCTVKHEPAAAVLWSVVYSFVFSFPFLKEFYH